MKAYFLVEDDGNFASEQMLQMQWEEDIKVCEHTQKSQILQK